MKFLLALFGFFTPPPNADYIQAGELCISKESKELILYYETGGSSYYTAKLEKPTLPPGASGITIGIGYDLGYNTPAQIRADWTGHLPAQQIERLVSVSGLTQARARAAMSRVADIRIPWATALAVYDKKTTPRFASITTKAYPGLTKMNYDIQGVILSTTFNRGASFKGDRRRELLWTRNDIHAGKSNKLSSYQLQMRRLWPTIRGLQRRYTAHAGMIEQSLK
jgi:hypothetical protein